ncbi:putative ABC transport system permease protein [Thermomonospora echinospora]|uniref:Putative ABC transport system permease protein n=1 Tax=Thermomonospora echinospora TaxID=1992 RepID=A0A1H6CHZ3_9ACTN|nr:FtsX-like permease family protein [Thermomonospora echinospora]SEG72538.1 putative ABC transport system permease protein [Thermomonospora echinospora]
MLGRILLVGRIAVRDLRRRRIETALLLLALTAATTTLTLGLVLRDAAGDPYQSTREATGGPDVVAGVDRHAKLSDLEELAGAPGVIDHGGPYPVTPAKLQASGRTSDVQAVGRDATPASVDQPKLIQGDWVSDGGVVVEAAFAKALDVRVGDPVTLDGRSFEVVGVAVTAAMPPYPGGTCIVAVGCASGATPEVLAKLPPGLLQNPGLVWLTQADVRRLAPDPGSLAYVMNLKLADPDEARAFVDAHSSEGLAAPRLESWENILEGVTELARDARILLMIGAWLLGLLAVASVSVLVGGRMADQTKRVGLLKAAGGTPGLVAAVLLAEYVLVAVVAAAAGLAAGSLIAPLLTGFGAGLIGGTGTPSMTMSTVGSVTAVAVGVAVVATVVPALRAARSSTVDALAGSPRPPRRTGWLIVISARLPVPLLLALRVVARRPRRVVLGVVSIAITVSGIYVALVLNAFLTAQPLAAGVDDAQAELLRQALLAVMVILFSLAAVNAIFITWATALDNRHSSALARALGATPGEVSAALAAAQVLPALAGAIVGAFPGGFVLFHAINAITGGDSDRATLPPLWQLLALVLATVLVVAALTAVPAYLGGHRPVTETLRAELA